ncbi:MAG TPA: hypothetical protein VKE70_36550 [Candidatus Solibacter sp.]|nr:hypothetical protein [Candidatus Solibacter sp.]
MSRSISRFLIAVLGVISASAQLKVETYTGRILTDGPAQDSGLAQVLSLTWDTNGRLVLCDTVNSLLRRVRSDGMLESVAGGVTGFSGDGGPARLATLNWPGQLKSDGKGNLYFADKYNFRIRRIDAQGVITTVAGDGVFLQDGMDRTGPALERSLDTIADLAPDSAGNVYFTERGNQIRRVTPDGRIEIFASAGLPDLLTVDAIGNLYALEHTPSPAIRRFAPDGTSVGIAGYGPPVQVSQQDDGQPAANLYFYEIGGLAAAGGKVYFIQGRFPYRDPMGPRIRVIDESGIVHTIAGGQGGSQSSPDGPALPSVISPAGLAADARGYVAFTETSGVTSATVIREVTPDGTLKTIAGGSPKPAPDGTPARNAWYVSLSALAFNHAGELLLADAGACMIRKVGATGVLTTIAGTGKCAQASTLSPATGPDLAPPRSIAVDSQNRVYMLDTFGNSYVITPDGMTMPTHLLPALGQGQIAIDSKDRIYLLDLSSLTRTTADGTRQTIVKPPSQPGVPPPGFGPASMSAIGTDPAGNVYFTGTYLGAPTDYFFRVNDDGTFTQVYGSSSNPLHLLNSHSLTVDAGGSVWYTAGLLNLMNSAGNISIGRQEPGYSGDGGLAQMARFNVSAVVLGPDGALYLLDNNRVRRISGAPQSNTPVIAPGGIVNALSYTSGAIAPGELLTVFGSGFEPAALQVAAPVNNRYPYGLSATNVLFNDQPGGVITAMTPTQINVFSPPFLPSGKVNVKIQIDTLLSAPLSVPVAKTAPGFTPIVLNQNGTINSPSNPAPVGSIISLYGTGEGAITPLLVPSFLTISTPYGVPNASVAVTIGGKPAEILYAGEAPFEPVGILQINARIPASLAAGSVPVLVTVGDATAKPVTIAVR